MSLSFRQFSFRDGIVIDRHSVLLAVLFVAVTLASVSLVPWATASGAEPMLAGESAGTQAAAGGAWALAEAAFAGLLLVGILLWRKFPEWVRDALSDALEYGGFLFVGALVYDAGVLWEAILAIGGIRLFFKALHEYDLFWLFNNTLAIGLAILIGAWLGVELPVAFFAVGLVGLAIYDHYFANKKRWMFDLLEMMLKLKLPVIILFPKGWRLDWEDLTDEEAWEDDEQEGLMAIGTADVMLPAMFAAAVAARPAPFAVAGIPVEVLGVLAGVVIACLRLRWIMLNRGSGAGMPALAGGTLGGYAVAAVAVGVVA